MLNSLLFARDSILICLPRLQNRFLHRFKPKFGYHTLNKRPFNTLNTFNPVKYRYFSSLSENGDEDVDVELELQNHCEQLKQFVVFDRLNENKNLNSFLTRMSINSLDEYLKRIKVTNYTHLRNLEKFMNVLYTFSCCGFHSNPDDLKRFLDGLHKEYMTVLANFKNNSQTTSSEDFTTYNAEITDSDSTTTQNGASTHIKEPNKENSSNDPKYNKLERLGKVLSLAVLSCCELGIFKDNLKKVSEILESFLFGDLFNTFLERSSGKLINSILFLYSSTQFFEKNYDSEMEAKYDSIIQSISKKETSLDLSDLYYLRLGHLFITSRIPDLNKKLSKESTGFLTNVVFQDYIKEKDLHGLEDAIPSNIKQIDTNIEGGLFNIGLYTFTHVSLPKKNVYLLNSPNHYFNSNLKFGKREYINWMASFLKTSGWNLVYL